MDLRPITEMGQTVLGGGIRDGCGIPLFANSAHQNFSRAAPMRKLFPLCAVKSVIETTAVRALESDIASSHRSICGVAESRNHWHLTGFAVHGISHKDDDQHRSDRRRKSMSAGEGRVGSVVVVSAEVERWRASRLDIPPLTRVTPSLCFEAVEFLRRTFAVVGSTAGKVD